MKIVDWLWNNTPSYIWPHLSESLRKYIVAHRDRTEENAILESIKHFNMGLKASKEEIDTLLNKEY